MTTSTTATSSAAAATMVVCPSSSSCFVSMSSSPPSQSSALFSAAQQPMVVIRPLPMKRVVSLLEEEEEEAATAARANKKQCCFWNHNTASTSSMSLPSHTNNNARVTSSPCSSSFKSRRSSFHQPRPQQGQQQGPANHQKTVRFSPQAPQWGEAATLSNQCLDMLEMEELLDERSLLWYNRHELAQLKLQAKQVAKQVGSPQLELALFDAHAAAASLDDDENDLQPDTTTAPASSSSSSSLHNAARPLLAHAALISQQRGLERWTSKMHLLGRCVRVIQVRSELVLEQSRQTLSTHAQQQGNAQQGADPERLAAVCAQASAASARFARVLGWMDAQLAKEE